MNDNTLRNHLFITFGLLLCSISIFMLRLLSMNFTPRMYFYTVPVNTSSKISSTVQRLSFTSQENYLGIISIVPEKFPLYDAEATLRFRLYKKGSPDFIIENSYRFSEVYQSKEFPFGFPVQNDSKDVQYYFDLFTDSQATESSLLDLSVANITIRHYFPKNYFLLHPLEITNLMGQKIYQCILACDKFTTSFYILIFPSLYLIFISLSNSGKVMQQISSFFKIQGSRSDLFFMVVLLIDIFLQKSTFFYISCCVLIASLFFTQKTTVRMNIQKKLIVYSLVLFVISGVLFFIQFQFYAKRVSAWMFVFMMIFSLLILLDRPSSRDHRK